MKELLLLCSLWNRRTAVEAIGQSAGGDPIALGNLSMRFTALLTLIKSKLNAVFFGQLRWLIGHRENEVGGELYE